MLYSCTHVATMDVKGLNLHRESANPGSVGLGDTGTEYGTITPCTLVRNG